MTESEEPLPQPDLPAERPRRAATFFGRISQALREQNWAAVVIEVCIVIVGVVIGFQVTAWGQSRSDVAREAALLRQLAADLAKTERVMSDTDRTYRSSERASSLVHRTFFTPEPPPRDSLLFWLGRSVFGEPQRPVLGTARALVATGDLALVRNDSLRSAITEYLEDAQRESEIQVRFNDYRYSGTRTLATLHDSVESIMAVLPPDRLEYVVGFPLSETAYFAGPRRSPLPLDVGRFRDDGVARQAAGDVEGGLINMRLGRDRMRNDAAALRERVEVELRK